MKTGRLWIFVLGVALVPGVVAPAQQQAAEAPATPRAGNSRPAVAARHGIVAAGHPIAASAGLQILLKGGNAFDAAAAVGAMEAMAEPEMNGIGGNGFMTVYHAKTRKVWSLAMTGAAPLALRPEEMNAETLDTGMKAGIVPGNLGGYLAALERFGTLSVGEVFAPAIEYAENGYPIDPMLAGSIDRGRATLMKYETTARIFAPNGRPLMAGDIYKNPDYAATLRKLVDAESRAKSRGAGRSAAIRAAVDRFYRGDIAMEMDRFFREQGGLITAKDLAAYEARWTEPIHASYRGYDVYSNPSTSRGGFEVLMGAGILEGFDLKTAGRGSAKALHAIIESIKLSKADIYRYVADPKTVRVPESAMLSPEYAARRRGLIDPGKAMEFPPAGDLGSTIPAPTFARPEGKPFTEAYDPEQHTTSFSIVDRFGNAVGCTPTLGGLFGSNVIVGSTGLFLNNGMRLGSTSPYPDNVNYVGAGKIPLLNNSPVIVLKDGKPVFVFGTPGGETIGQTELQMLVHLIDFEMPIQDAIEAPRLALEATPNFYKPGAAIRVSIEGRAPKETIEALEAMGHTIRVLPGWGSIGHMQAIRIDPKTGLLSAGADPRRTGYAIGY